MLHVALRQCLTRPVHRCSPTSSLQLPCTASPVAQQRSRTWLSRILGVGFNSVRESRRVRPRRKTKSVIRASKAPLEKTAPTPIRKTIILKHKPTSEDDKSSDVISKRQPARPRDQVSSASQSPQSHHDLLSFQRWSSANRINKDTTYFIGTKYEYTVQDALKRFGFTLSRSGGPNDQGIDLIGHWPVPTRPGGFKVLVQCKVSRPTSAIARELEGACSGGRQDWRAEGVMAWLASPKPASKSTWDTMQRSTRPMGFVQISQDAKIGGFMCNDAAKKAGLAGLATNVTYTSSRSSGAISGRTGRIVTLSIQDQQWPARIAMP